MSKKYRMITRSDMDGIVCAALLKELDMIDEIKFVHPKDMQDGLIEVTSNDILTNLPYHPNAHMVFDHHASEAERNKPAANLVNDPSAPSAAYVVYHHFGGAAKFPRISKELMDAANKIDSAQLSKEDILNPQGWTLLGYIMDNRTGLGRYHDFRISNYQLMLEFVNIFRQYSSIEDIMKHPDVAERVKMYKDHAEDARKQIERCAEIKGKCLVLDYRKEEQIYCINRFAIYALYPDINVSVHIMSGKKGMGKIVFAVGKSVLNRTAKADIGHLMLEYGGGGHKAVGTCQIEEAKADAVKKDLIQRIVDAA